MRSARPIPSTSCRRKPRSRLRSSIARPASLSQSAGEYERVANESTDPALRAEALLLAGNLYEQSQSTDRALDVYSRYVAQFPKPIEAAVETRFKIAEIHKGRGDDALYHKQLDGDRSHRCSRRRRANRADAQPRRALGAGSHRAALRQLCRGETAPAFREEPARKAARDEPGTGRRSASSSNYEVGEVTAAATYYMAEIYANFGRSLLESERPAGLKAAALQKYNDAARGRGVPVRGEGHQGPREESRADGQRLSRRVDREESRATRRF